MYNKGKYGLSRNLNLILMDEVCLVTAFVAAYLIRHGVTSFSAFSPYINILVVLCLVNICLITYGNLLDNVLKRGYYQELAHTVTHVVLLVLVGSFYVFSTQSGEDYSRIVIYVFGLLYIVLSYTCRLLWKRYIRQARSKPDAVSIFLITTADQAEQVVKNVTQGTGSYRILGLCITDRDCVGSKFGGVTVNAALSDYAQFLCREWCDEVYIALDRNLPYTLGIIDKLVEMGIVVHFEIENFKNCEYPHQIVEKFEARNVITMSMNMASERQLLLKRIIDILAGLAGCCITLVLTLILGPLIFFQSPGPIFFKQVRIGKNGRKFTMYKFRSMYMDAEKRKQELMKENRIQDGMMFKMEHDPRIIGCKIRPDGTVRKGVGNFIRDWSLDEFPQFFNVLIGNMSLCGTRPPTQDEWNKYELHHRARLAIKPGITGLWQVSGRSRITDFEEVVRLDKEYITNWSLGLDLQIILKTFKVVLGKDGAM